MTMTPEKRMQLGARRAKHYYRIREELGNNNQTMKSVAVSLGVTLSAVSAVIRGTCHSKKVLNKLREVGVPEKYLFDPNKQEAV